MGNDKPLVLVDGSSYLFRAYHALPALTTSSHFPTGAIKGVIAMLKRLAKDYAGSPIAVVFDAKGKSFRNDLYPAYKQNRPPMPDDLRQQIQPIHDIIRALGLPLLIVDGVEADDVIGTLAHEATSSRRDVVISTSDKDIAQLVSDHVTLVNTMTDTRLDRAGVVEKFGVPPELMVDYLALIGDTSDNVPGVPNVGPKTAAKWLTQYGSLDGIVVHADEISGKVGENLRAHLDTLPLARELVTIKCDVPLPMGIEALVPDAEDSTRLRELYETFEFRAWLEELTANEHSEARAPAAEYETLLDAEAFERWTKMISTQRRVVVGVTTNSGDYMRAELVGLSFALEPGVAAYLPIGHDYPGAPEQLAKTEVLDRLKPLLEEVSIVKLGHDLKFEQNVLGNHGVALAGVEYDTMLESYVLDSVGSRHTLDDLAARHLGITPLKFETIASKALG